MRIQLEIDNVYRQIDTRDPETMARWLVEQFTEVDENWTPATYIRIQVWPTFSPDGREHDWITDASHWRPITGVRTPAAFLAELTAQLDQLDGPAICPACMGGYHPNCREPGKCLCGRRHTPSGYLPTDSALPIAPTEARS